MNEEECCQAKILVVDDIEMNLIPLIGILKSLNPSLITVEAQNGEIAVKKYTEALDKPCNCPNKGFKLVLMDL